MGPPSRKDGPIISFAKLNWKVYSVYSGVVALARKKPEGGRSPYTDSPKLKGKRKKTAPPPKKKIRLSGNCRKKLTKMPNLELKALILKTFRKNRGLLKF